MLLKSLVESCGLKISKERRHGEICAIDTLLKIFTHHGYEHLDRSLRLIVSTWEGDMLSLTSNMIKGISTLLAVFGDSINDEKFAERTGTASLREIAREAKDRREGSKGYTMVLAKLYNKNRKAQLEVQKIYEYEGPR